ncbi:MAG: 16S rRNA (guanine(527)-N(7))-methyltransferase RsmG [Defluviitaleaceae bacterium]|nr:16S rRNA (guanine(527)-N(7))-methyltransferase RsmG [Defluviitaleaceae bacterium]
MDTLRVKNWLDARDIQLPDAAWVQMAQFQSLVLTANQTMNLTAITSDEDFAIKHFIDSLSLLPLLPPPQAGRNWTLLDVGTGAGFPGVPLKIARVDLDVTLLDATRKRLDFLQIALEKLGLAAQCLHARAEELPRLQPRLTFDLVTARAVARLDKLIGYTLPLVAPGGYFFAMKGPDVSQEMEEARPTLKKHRATIEKSVVVALAPGMTHTIIVIRKAA